MSKQKAAKILCTWFGSGLAPKASGTFGSLAALPFAYGIQCLGGNELLLMASIGIFFIGWLASYLYMKDTDAKDPKEIVIDEVAGMWLLLSCMAITWQAYLVGFALFRLFDVLKPWPVSFADQKIGGAFGVMFDDILAAIYPLVIGWLLTIMTHNYTSFFTIF